MEDITILNNDTLVIKIDKLQKMIDTTVWRQILRLQQSFEKNEDEDEIIPKWKVIKMLDISPSTYDNWVKKGRLKAHKIGDKPFVYLSDLKDAMKPVN